MLRDFYNYIHRFNKATALLVLIFCFVIATKGISGAQASLVANSDTINLPPGVLSGSVYLPSSNFAFSDNQIGSSSPSNVSVSFSGYTTSSVKISSGSLSQNTPISPLDFGANEIWYDNGYGVQNPTNNQLYSSVVNLVKSIGVSVIRYPGGIPSDTFNWQSAIGPQSQRTDNVVYQSQDDFLSSAFGPDEFGQLLQETNAAGDITVNFGTGTAQEAADWVQYMTASSKTNYWGEMRAKNGHPAPYNIPYWEVGNEQQSSSGENYWRSGSVVSINNKNDQCPNSDIHLCEYVFGGTTAFKAQEALGANNNSLGNGTVGQVFYTKYPPIVTGSQAVYINGQTWQQVANIASAPRGARVYQLVGSTGKISFGDGTHGSVVPKNARVTISYESGPHDGFIEYYKLMKAADPTAHICSSYDSLGFVQLMGSTDPYDCLVSHLYAGDVPSTQSSVTLFHNSLMQQSYSFANVISTQQAWIRRYAGAQAKNISIAVTEYGVNALTNPVGHPNYHRSLDMALFVANSLRVMIDAHIPIAEKHFLISYENSQPSGTQAYFNSPAFANNALIAGPGPNPVPQPSAYVLEAYTKLLYSNFISSKIQNDPSVVYSQGNYPALSAIATTDKKGDESIMVINLSPANSIQAEIQPSLNDYTHVDAWTLGSSSFLAYNTPANPSAVGFVKKSTNLYAGSVVASFPPSSVTVLQLSK